MNFDRTEALRRLADEQFDVLVVGGGITGAGVALDAATRGLRTALIERDDLASGTSSKSSKLVHGGIRYLQQREVGLVYEALAERQVLRHTAPHLVRVLPFLLPVFTHDGLLPRRLARLLGTTMWAYDLTGGLRIGKLHKRVSKEEALRYMPTLHADNVAASYVYYDAQTDDARLTLAVARTAADYGATIANYRAVSSSSRRAPTATCTPHVEADGTTFTVRARLVVNATGVWADDVAALDEGKHPSSIRPAKGVHITVPWSLVQNQIAAVIPVPKDRRSVSDRAYFVGRDHISALAVVLDGGSRKCTRIPASLRGRVVNRSCRRREIAGSFGHGWHSRDTVEAIVEANFFKIDEKECAVLPDRPAE